MKHLTKHTSRSAFDSVKASLATPHVALISYGHNKIVGHKKDGDSGFNEHVLEGTVAGDIAYYNGTEVKFCSADSWSESLGTPIGVVVIPSSHREDGKSVVMSLANMSLQTPETGSLATEPVANDNYMYWGDYRTDLPLTNYKGVPTVDPEDGTSVALGFGYMRSDIPNGQFTELINDEGDIVEDESEATSKSVYTVENGIISYVRYRRYDTESEWGKYRVMTPGAIVLSPYNEDGSKNENFQYAGSAFESLDGKANQEVIMNACTAGATGVIENSYTTGNYPAARACSRFHTVGTEAGDWYLPSIGEIVYLFARVSKVAHAIEVLGSSKAVMFKYCPDNAWIWSSTEYSTSLSWILNTNCGYANGYYKNLYSDYYRVRAFVAL